MRTLIIHILTLGPVQTMLPARPLQLSDVQTVVVKQPTLITWATREDVLTLVGIAMLISLALLQAHLITSARICILIQHTQKD